LHHRKHIIFNIITTILLKNSVITEFFNKKTLFLSNWTLWLFKLRKNSVILANLLLGCLLKKKNLREKNEEKKEKIVLSCFKFC